MRILLALLNLSVAMCLSAADVTPEDEAAIRNVIAERRDAFNRHEPKLSPAAISSDIDVIKARGDYLRGKPDLKDAFATALKNARMFETVDRIRLIRPDVALADGTFEVSGTDIQPYPKGLQMWLLVKENGRWVITAIRQMVPAVAKPRVP